MIIHDKFWLTRSSSFGGVYLFRQNLLRFLYKANSLCFAKLPQLQTPVTFSFQNIFQFCKKFPKVQGMVVLGMVNTKKNKKKGQTPPLSP